ncbi:uncharacterized protein B0H18DRAFT_1005162 [Fomitopsis serialis]|uniref:uncharacterized protein n=1 Tax=Fomitopsis serialis TaxID=139415 RepID=UPI00200889D6|nr:uncharacterized protein B0H18DRAFT_1005162 [Neoantrodia serialis]KAH9926697.1 hypothetical protein B0H18DRAFT_1005162 [Neoantrodia serialis]
MSMNHNHAVDTNDLSKTTAARSSVPRTKGYFAFPPTVTPDGRVVFTFTVNEDPQTAHEREERAARAVEAERQERLKEEAWQEKLRRDAQQREKRRAQERAEALIGEMDWVRSGGSLRDANGRLDKVRTEQLREEVRILDEDTRLTKLWDSYETRWRALLATTDPVTFTHIPWPLPVFPKAVDELAPAAIEEFLLGPLRVRKNTVTKRERIRASLLRWHPDKISNLLSRVIDEDQAVVREGVHVVFRCLKAMQDSDRRNPDMTVSSA